MCFVFYLTSAKSLVSCFIFPESQKMIFLVLFILKKNGRKLKKIQEQKGKKFCFEGKVRIKCKRKTHNVSFLISFDSVSNRIFLILPP